MMQELPPEPTPRRLNIRAVIVLTVVLAVLTIAAVVIHFGQASRLRRNALQTARNQIDEGNADLALKNLDALLQSYPDDREASELKARLLAAGSRTVEQLLQAAIFNDQFARANPDAPGAQEARRRTAELYIRFGDLYQESTYYRALPEATVFNVRYRSAAAIARELIDRGANDANAYLLLAEAQERLIQGRDSEMLGEAIRNYQRAISIDPAHLVAAERLANLLNERKSDKFAAIRVLDKLSRSRPESPELRLVRHRFFLKAGDTTRASAELEAALKLAPNDLAACLEAAELALRRGRTSEARRFTARIPDRFRDDLRVRLVLGLIEFNENHPETAIEIWRKGLVSSQGSDAMLTWNLAFSLLQLGRLAEAEPLVEQYGRLMSDKTSPMLNLLIAIREQKAGHSLKASLILEGLRDRIDTRWKQLLDYTLGQAYTATGDLNKSILSYRRVLEENPRAVAARVDLAEALLDSRPREAAEIIETGLQSSPDDSSLRIALASARLRLQETTAEGSRSWESFDQAMAQAIELAPNHSSIALIRSRRQSLDGKIDEANAQLDASTRRDPRNAKLWEGYIETLLKAGRTADVLSVLERAAKPEAIGDTVGVRLARFKVLQGLGRAREAHQLLAKDIGRFTLDQRAQIWAVLGPDLASRGETAGARDVYAEWARRIPEDIQPRLAQLDIALYGGEEDGRAASTALRSLGGPEDLTIRLDRARELIRTENPDSIKLREATQILESVRAQSPKLVTLYALQGELAERQGMTGEAVTAYRRAWSEGSDGAMTRLVNLLARKDPGELERLGSMNETPRLIRSAVQACLAIGQPDRAVRIAAVDRLAMATPEMLAWRTELLDRLGKTGKTEELFRAEATRRPELAEPWLALLRYQSRHRDAATIAATRDEARKAIKEARTEFIDARLCWAAGDRERADRAFRAGLAARPDDIEILLAASEFYQEAGQPTEVVNHLKRVLTLKPDHRRAARRLALYLAERPLDLAGWEQAWSVLGPEPTGGEDPEDRLVRAILLSKGPGPEHRSRAAGFLETLVADLPAEAKAAATARGLLARLLLDAGQPERAGRLIGPRIEQGLGGNPAELALYAEALIQSGRFDQAAVQLDRLAALAPADDREPRLRARLVAARAVPGDAAGDLERAFVKFGKSPRAQSFGIEAFALIAVVQPPADDVAERVSMVLASKDKALSWMPALIIGRHGRAAEALRLCRAAAEVADPYNARETCRVASGVALGDAKVDHRGELEAIFETAARRDPEGTEIPLQLAQLRHRQGRYQEAVNLYQSVIKRRPDLSPSIQNNVAWILSEDLHNPGEALKVVDDLLRSEGRTVAVLDTRGVILTRLGRTSEAIKDLEESIRNGAPPVHLFHLARAYRVAGKTEDFKRCRDLALRAGLTPEQVEPSERAELTALLRR